MLPALAIHVFLTVFVLSVHGFSSTNSTNSTTSRSSSYPPSSSLGSSTSTSSLSRSPDSSTHTSSSSTLSSTSLSTRSLNSSSSSSVSSLSQNSSSTSDSSKPNAGTIVSASNDSTANPATTSNPTFDKFVFTFSPNKNATVAGINAYTLNGTITSAPLATGISPGSFLNSSLVTGLNASTASPGLGLYLTTEVNDQNQTVTVCPNFIGYHGGPDERDQTCCRYYNASSVVNTALFSSWVSNTDPAVPSPDVGAIYSCCGECKVRASSVQIYYWPGATPTNVVTCTGPESVQVRSWPNTTMPWTYLDEGVTYTSVIVQTATTQSITWPNIHLADATLGCNGTQVTAVVDNYTMTSPIPYIRFTSVYEYDWCGKIEGGYDVFINSLPTGLLTLASSTTSTATYTDISSDIVTDTLTYDVYNDVNFADYDKCLQEPGCEPIVKVQFYNYGMGRFKGCNNIVNGYYDPPIALGKASDLGGQPTPPPVSGNQGSGNGKGNGNGNGNPKPGGQPNPPAQPVQTGGAGNPSFEDGKGNGDGSQNGNGNPPGNSGNGNEQPGQNNNGNNNRNSESNPVSVIAGIFGGGSNGDKGSNNPETPAQDPPGANENPPTKDSLPHITVDGQTYQPNSNGQYNIGSQTLVVGGPTITVGGTPVAIAPGGGAIVVGSNTLNMDPNPAAAVGGTPPPTISLGPNMILTLNPGTNSNGQPVYYVLPDGQTLVPGGAPITVSGTPVALAPSASALVIGGMTHPLPTAAPYGTYPPITQLGTQAVTAANGSPAGYVIDGQTLLPGGAPLVISGTTLYLSAGPGGTAVIMDDGHGDPTIIPVNSMSAGSLPPAVTIGSHTLTLNPQGQYVSGSQTITPGGTPVIIDGTTFSMTAGPTGTSIIVVNGASTSTVPLNSGTIGLPSTIVAGGQTLTLDTSGAYVFGTQTLLPGGSAITIHGTVFSLPPHATAPITVGLDPKITNGLGELILRGLGATSSKTSTSRPKSNTRSGAKETEPTAGLPESVQAKPTGGVAGRMGGMDLCGSIFAAVALVLGILAL